MKEIFKIHTLLILIFLYAISGWITIAFAQNDFWSISKNLLEEIRTGKTDLYKAYASEELINAVPAAQITPIWNQLEGQLGKASDTVIETDEMTQGEFVQHFQALEFGSTVLAFLTVFNAEGKISGIAFRPYQLKKTKAQLEERAPYDNPEFYTEQEVIIQSGTYRLPGTLTRPKSGKPEALVLFLTGSGPNDRHSTVGPNRPHQDMAGGLAQKGIASLRFDKRTFVAPEQIEKENLELTIDSEVTDDAVAAVAFARSLPDINSNRIFLLGHSLGGMMAPRIASKIQLSGIIIMAGNARPLEELLIDQYDTLLQGREDKEMLMSQLYEQIQNLNLMDQGKEISEKELPLGQPAHYWKSLRDYDQVATAKRLHIPILILQGEMDYQVTMKDFNIWKEQLPTAISISYSELDHLMRPSNGKIGMEAYIDSAFVEEKVIQDIADWIKNQL